MKESKVKKHKKPKAIMKKLALSVGRRGAYYDSRAKAHRVEGVFMFQQVGKEKLVIVRVMAPKGKGVRLVPHNAKASKKNSYRVKHMTGGLDTIVSAIPPGGKKAVKLELVDASVKEEDGENMEGNARRTHEVRRVGLSNLMNKDIWGKVSGKKGFVVTKDRNGRSVRFVESVRSSSTRGTYGVKGKSLGKSRVVAICEHIDGVPVATHISYDEGESIETKKLKGKVWVC